MTRKEFLRGTKKPNKDPDAFTRDLLITAGKDESKPGISVEDTAQGQIIIYRDKKGNPVGAATIQPSVQSKGNSVIAFGVDKNKGVIASKAAIEIGKILIEKNALKSSQTISKDAKNLLHHYLVKNALSEGKTVPPEVLADYPDLVKKAPEPNKKAKSGVLEESEVQQTVQAYRDKVESRLGPGRHVLATDEISDILGTNDADSQWFMDQVNQEYQVSTDMDIHTFTIPDTQAQTGAPVTPPVSPVSEAMETPKALTYAPSGRPFKTEAAAKTWARKNSLSAAPVAVQGGFALKAETKPEAPPPVSQSPSQSSVATRLESMDYASPEMAALAKEITPEQEEGLSQESARLLERIGELDRPTADHLIKVKQDEGVNLPPLRDPSNANEKEARKLARQRAKIQWVQKQAGEGKKKGKAATEAKQPWQMTLNEYFASKGIDRAGVSEARRQKVEDEHRALVREAVERGEDVPKPVLALHRGVAASAQKKAKETPEPKSEGLPETIHRVSGDFITHDLGTGGVKKKVGVEEYIDYLLSEGYAVTERKSGAVSTVLLVKGNEGSEFRSKDHIAYIRKAEKENPQDRAARLEEEREQFRFASKPNPQTQGEALSKFLEGSTFQEPMYHGTVSGRFNIFEHKQKRDSGMYGQGFYFANSPSYASMYTQGKEKPIGGKKKPYLFKVWLSSKDTLDLDNATEKDWNRLWNALQEIRKEKGLQPLDPSKYDYWKDKFINPKESVATSAIYERAQAMNLIASPQVMARSGYDGIVAYGGREAVVFRPEQIKSVADNIGTFDPKNPDIRYGSAPKPTPESTAKRTRQVQSWIKSVSSKLAQRVEVVGSVDEWPEPYRSEAQAYQKRTGRLVQAVWSKEGTILLAADAIGSRDEAVWKVLHETVGHDGLRQVLGDAFDDFLGWMLQSKYRNEILSRAKELKVDERTAAEEWFAEQAEQINTSPGIPEKLKSAWNRFQVMMRRWLRSLGLYGENAAVKLGFGEPELRELLRRSLEAAQRGPGPQSKGDKRFATTLGKQAQTQSEAFQKWFGDSKVVDSEGNPLMVYHGASSDFTVFQPHYAPGWGKGIYFSDSPNDAAAFADGPGGRSIPAFLQMQNPFVSGKTDRGDFWRRSAETQAWEKAQAIYNRGKENPSLTPQTVWREDAETVNAILREMGYDGIIAPPSAGVTGTEYVVFEPIQVKSATGNRGTFDSSDPDIRHSTRSERGWVVLDEDQKKKVEALALARFGETDKFDQAGFVLPDGRLLKIGRDKPHPDGGDRYYHAEVAGRLLDGIGLNYMARKSLNTLLVSGWVRILPDSGNVEAYAEPTSAQYLQIRKYSESEGAIKNGGVQVDLMDLQKGEDYSEFITSRRLASLPELIKRFYAGEDVYGAPSLARQFRYASKPANNAGALDVLNVPDETLVQQTLRKTQDRLNRADQIIQLAKEQGKTVSLPEDFYMAYRLYPKTTAHKTDNVLKREVEYMQRLDEQSGYTIDDVDVFWQALHAEERNDLAKERSDGKYESGSGMSQATADALLKKYGGANGAIRPWVDEAMALAKESNRFQYESGLLTKAEYDYRNQMFKFYGPLKGFKEEKGTPAQRAVANLAKGFGIRRKESMRIKGRQAGSLPDNVVVQSVADYQTAIVNAEKEQVMRAFLKFNQDKPIAGVSFALMKFKPVYNKFGEIEYMEPRAPLKDNQVLMKVSQFEWGNEPVRLGDKEYEAEEIHGKPIVVTIEDPALLEGIKNLGVERSFRILDQINNFTRNMVTVYNPAFWMTNFPRDLGMAVINISGDEGKRAAWEVAKGVPSAIRGIWNAIEGDKTHPMAKVYEDLAVRGGKTGFFAMKPTKTLKADLEKELRHIRTNGHWRSYLRKVAEAVEHVNEAIEMGTRLSYYKWLVDHGVDPKEAAFKAGDLTVDFNLKGQWGSMLNSWHLFTNANIQGVAKMLKVMGIPPFQKGGNKRGQKKVQKLMGSLFLGSLALNLAYSLYDPDDWDEISDFNKDTNLMVPIPGTRKYVSLKLPYGFNLFHALGNITADLILGKKTFAQTAGRIMERVNDTVNPWSASTPFQFAVPSATMPWVQIYENKNFFGGPIYKEQFPGAYKPNNEMHFKSVSPYTQSVTSFLNDISGGQPEKKRGTKVLQKGRSGLVDINPETIDHLFESYLGGVGRLVGDGATTMVTFAQGEIPEVNSVPFLRILVKEPTPYMAQQKVFEMLRESTRRSYGKTEKEQFEKSLGYMLKEKTVDREKYNQYRREFENNQRKLRAGGLSSMAR